MLQFLNTVNMSIKRKFKNRLRLISQEDAQ